MRNPLSMTPAELSAFLADLRARGQMALAAEVWPDANPHVRTRAMVRLGLAAVELRRAETEAEPRFRAMRERHARELVAQVPVELASGLAESVEVYCPAPHCGAEISVPLDPAHEIDGEIPEACLACGLRFDADDRARLAESAQDAARTLDTARTVH